MKLPAGKEDAVSPVIGVMLMIVVTVVIAAVVVIFSTGMAGDSTATTPMALFEADNQNVGPVSISGTTVNLLKSFDIVHKGGDEVIAENIQIVIESKKGSGDDTEFDFESGIQLVRKVNDVTILSGDSITTGERIRITLNPTATDHEKIFIGSLVKWTLFDTRTNGIIAKGEFVVPKA
ncbi:type IV pilin N-terminal domain-containing protein [Methanocorpusculaceae archaeon]|nr:type IV pilin N-terminal domain-containing protein [Methanocorpusculaceae archaeon]